MYEITPALAAKLMSTSLAPYPLVQAGIDKMSAELRAEPGRLMGALVFRAGHLLCAIHRVSAIAATGIPAQMLVYCDDGSFADLILS